ncbi:DsbA family oxidoreductase [Flavobacteriaceae bacterium AU392]|nr:DsbA family oxidoreductase [Flavobacteriaceae bacterium]RKM85894.1 DsbA family oxidoreductase [Flavobacteriaceae bacterium AU392]
MTEEKIKVDIVSDVACPWCYVGMKRLESALQQWKGASIEIEWHPYQLDPTIPQEGINRITYLENKFGDIERTKPMADAISDAGEELGIAFNFSDKWLAVNTLPLHQLLHVAGEEGFKEVLKERFFKAYFDENLHLNSIDVLSKIMAEYSWDRQKVERIINDDTIAYAVTQEIKHYQQRGVSSVPFFIINDKYGISGAQPSNVFLQVFESVAPIKTENGESCDSTTGEC